MMCFRKTLLMMAAIISATTSQIASAQYENVPSGMLLGIYARPMQGGLGVAGFIPGYSAEQVLSRGDVLMRATTDGVTMYPIRSLYDMERVKSTVGAYVDTALEIYRPGVGYVYAMVTFTPVYGPAAASPGIAASPANRQAPKQFSAQFKSEREKPQARSLFQNSRPQNKLPTQKTLPKFPNTNNPSITLPRFPIGKPQIGIPNSAPRGSININRASQLFNR